MDKPSEKRPITTRDVAEAAGVNQSTVSRALRGEQSISKETRLKVQRAARKLGYRPNPYVSAFTAQVRSYRRAPRTATIAMVNCWDSDYRADFLDGYRKGAQERTEELGFTLDPIHFEDVNRSVKRLVHVIQSRGIHGLLILPVPEATDLSSLNVDNLAAATIDLSLKRPKLHRAVPDYFSAMAEALSRLESQGYGRIGFCTQEVEMARIGHLWMGAYLTWQRSQPEEHRLQPHVDRGWDQDALLRWVEREQPDAIVANEHQFLYWLEAAGMRAPEDVAFASLGRIKRDPHIAGINQNFGQVGAAAADLVVGQIYRNDYGLPGLEKTVLIEGIWVDAKTVRMRS